MIVLAGDRIGKAEEFSEGYGTYEENGEIFAAVAGILIIKDKKAIVDSFNKIPHLRKGDIVIGRIVDIRGNVAMVEIARKKGFDRSLAHTKLGILHASSCGKDFAKAVSYYDIVRARVIDPPKLSIVEPEMGVLKAYCSSCRSELIFSEGKLICTKCGKIEERKISEIYGKGEW